MFWERGLRQIWMLFFNSDIATSRPYNTSTFFAARYLVYSVMTTLGRNPITPPPLPSHPGIGARHTGHLTTTASAPKIPKQTRHRTNLAMLGSRVNVIAPLCSVVLTAVKRQAPQHICPQGVMVAFVGGLKQIGQVYSDNVSGGGGGGGVGVGVGVGVRCWW